MLVMPSALLTIPLGRADLQNYLAAMAFAGLVLGGLGLVLLDRRCKSPRVRRRLASLFVLYVVAVSFTAGIARRNLWPFGSWAMMTLPPPQSVGPDLPFSWLYGVTADGQEHDLDYRVWEPLSVAELLAWMEYRSAELPAAERRRLGAVLLQQANARRERALAGQDPGRFGRLLGPLQAPTHLMYRGRWQRAEDVPAEPLVGIRWYREFWNIEGRKADPSRVERVLGFEYMAEP
jgi:hypothetical protein